MEYRAALAIMGDGNFFPHELVRMVEAGEVFFHKAEAKDFEKCPICKRLFEEHKRSFINPTDLARQRLLQEKLARKGLFTRRNQAFADPAMRFAAAAAEGGLTGVIVAGTRAVNLDPFCKAAVVDTVEVSDFKSDLERAA